VPGCGMASSSVRGAPAPAGGVANARADRRDSRRAVVARPGVAAVGPAGPISSGRHVTVGGAGADEASGAGSSAGAALSDPAAAAKPGPVGRVAASVAALGRCSAAAGGGIVSPGRRRARDAVSGCCVGVGVCGVVSRGRAGVAVLGRCSAPPGWGVVSSARARARVTVSGCCVGAGGGWDGGSPGRLGARVAASECWVGIGGWDGGSPGRLGARVAASGCWVGVGGWDGGPPGRLPAGAVAVFGRCSTAVDRRTGWPDLRRMSPAGGRSPVRVDAKVLPASSWWFAVPGASSSAGSGADAGMCSWVAAGSPTMRRHKRRPNPGSACARGATGGTGSSGGSRASGRLLRLTRWTTGRAAARCVGPGLSRSATGWLGRAGVLSPVVAVAAGVVEAQVGDSPGVCATTGVGGVRSDGDSASGCGLAGRRATRCTRVAGCGSVARELGACRSSPVAVGSAAAEGLIGTGGVVEVGGCAAGAGSTGAGNRCVAGEVGCFGVGGGMAGGGSGVAAGGCVDVGVAGAGADADAETAAVREMSFAAVAAAAGGEGAGVGAGRSLRADCAGRSVRPGCADRSSVERAGAPVAASSRPDAGGAVGASATSTTCCETGVRESFSGRADPSTIAARRSGAGGGALDRACMSRATVASAARGENAVPPAGVSFPSRYSIAHGE